MSEATADDEAPPESAVTDGAGGTDGAAVTDGAAGTDGAAVTDGAGGTDGADDRTPGEKIAAVFEPVDAHLRRIDWYTIAKKEFSDAIRSRALVILTAVLVAIFVLPAAILLYTDVGPGAQAYTQQLVLGQVEVVALVTSIGGIAFGYAAVSGERERGSIKFLLGQPYDRWDVLVGKLVGRFATLTIPLFAVVVLRLVVVAPASAQSLPLRDYVVLLGLSMVLAAVFVSLAIGASAATSTTRRSMVVAGGVWAYLFLLWNSVSRGVPSIWNDLFGLDAAAQLEVELFLKMLHPGKAFQTLLSSFAGTETASARAELVGSLLLSPQEAVFQRQQIAAQLGEGVPWYLSDGVVVAVLAVWLVVPVLIGYTYFRAADL